MNRAFNGIAREHTAPKVVLLVNNNVTGNLITNNLVPSMRGLGIEPAIYVLHPDAPKGAKIPGLADFAFYESKILTETIFPFIEKSVVISPSGTPYPSSKSFRQLGQLHGIEVRDVKTMNDPEEITRIESDSRIIGAISIRNLELSEQPITDAFNRKGFYWNLHSGLLPQYRGVHPQLFAMRQGEEKCGWTLHEITAGVNNGTTPNTKVIDTGMTLGSAVWPLDPKRRDSYLSEFVAKVPCAAPLILHHLSIFMAGRRLTMDIKHEVGADRYYTFPTQQECDDMEKMGIRIANSQEMRALYLDQYSPGPLRSKLQRDFAIAVDESIAQWEGTRNSQADIPLPPRTTSDSRPALAA